jgi:hypothetical protein
VSLGHFPCTTPLSFLVRLYSHAPARAHTHTHVCVRAGMHVYAVPVQQPSDQRHDAVNARVYYCRYDVPAHYECSRDVHSDCYACGFAKCYEQIIARAQTLPAYPVAAGEVTEVCEEAVMNYCGYGTVQGVDEGAEGVVLEDAGDD